MLETAPLWDRFVGMRRIQGEVTGYWKDLFEKLDKSDRHSCFYKLFKLMIKNGESVKRIAKRFNIPERYVRQILGRKYHA